MDYEAWFDTQPKLKRLSIIINYQHSRRKLKPVVWKHEFKPTLLTFENIQHFIGSKRTSCTVTRLLCRTNAGNIITVSSRAWNLLCPERVSTENQRRRHYRVETTIPVGLDITSFITINGTKHRCAAGGNTKNRQSDTGRLYSPLSED